MTYWKRVILVLNNIWKHRFTTDSSSAEKKLFSWSCFSMLAFGLETWIYQGPVNSTFWRALVNVLNCPSANWTYRMTFSAWSSLVRTCNTEFRLQTKPISHLWWLVMCIPIRVSKQTSVLWPGKAGNGRLHTIHHGICSHEVKLYKPVFLWFALPYPVFVAACWLFDTKQLQHNYYVLNL